MLDFSDLPYEFFPPRYFPPTAWTLRQFNRTYQLPRKMRITRVDVRDAERLQVCRSPRDRLMLMPNHPTHADAAIFIEACRQVGLAPWTMAAYDVFYRSRLTQWVMQRLGCFSVDRDGADKPALDQALRTLTRTPHPLIVFPEGNVYLTNDRVTAFNDGGAMIAVKAAKALRDKPAGEAARVWAVPVSIKVTHVVTHASRRDADPRVAHEALLRETCEALGVEAAPDTPVRTLLRDAAIAALRRNLESRGVAVPEVADVSELPPRAAEAVLESLEAKIGRTPKPGEGVLDRVFACRRVIHAVRIDPERAIDHAAATTWADEAILAYRVATYASDYVEESPPLDRVGETIEKLSEDVFNRMPTPAADREAIVRFGEPIDVTDRLATGKQRAVVHAVTRDAEAAVQAGVDAINAELQSPGAEPWATHP